MSGFGPEIIAAALQREGGICAMSGALVRGVRLPRHRAETANHRLNRGAGGSAAANTIDNACAICIDCNGLIESDADYATAARHRGVKLISGERPELVPLWCVFYGMWVQLIGGSMELTGIRDETTRPDLPKPDMLDVTL